MPGSGSLMPIRRLHLIRLLFSPGGMVEFEYSVCAPPASPAAVGEAHRSLLIMTFREVFKRAKWHDVPGAWLCLPSNSTWTLDTEAVFINSDSDLAESKAVVGICGPAPAL
jgi:hypothetical protein